MSTGCTSGSSWSGYVLAGTRVIIWMHMSKTKRRSHTPSATRIRARFASSASAKRYLPSCVKESEQHNPHRPGLHQLWEGNRGIQRTRELSELTGKPRSHTRWPRPSPSTIVREMLNPCTRDERLGCGAFSTENEHVVSFWFFSCRRNRVTSTICWHGYTTEWCPAHLSAWFPSSTRMPFFGAFVALELRVNRICRA